MEERHSRSTVDRYCSPALILLVIGVVFVLAGGAASAAPLAHISPGDPRACQGCHSSRTGGTIAAPPSDNRLCYSCHTDAQGPLFPRALFEQGAHGPFWSQQSRTPYLRKGHRDPAERGLCVNCHDPHGAGPGRAMLRLGTKLDSTAQCTACHLDTQVYGAYSGPSVFAESAHGNPLTGVQSRGHAVGECLVCHDPHGRGNAKLLVSARGSEFCLGCHERAGGGFSLWNGRTGFLAPDAVHGNPPAVARPGVRRTYPGRDAAAGSCVNCHNPHGALDSRTGRLTPALTNAGGAELCYQCHTELRYTFTSRSRHGVDEPGTGLTCTSCHNPHAVSRLGYPVTDPRQPSVRMEYPSTAAFVRTTAYNAFCLRCHDGSFAGPAANLSAELAVPGAMGRFYAAGQNLHYRHVTWAGFGCANCHSSHGSASQGLLQPWIDAPAGGLYTDRSSCGTSGGPAGLSCHP